MDLRDPWTIEPIRDDLLKSKTRSRLENAMERRCMLAAARIVVNTPFAEDAYRRKYPDLAHKFTTITNGFDADDFQKSYTACLPSSVASSKATGRILLSHIGTFSRHGCRKPLPDAFLSALRQALDADSNVRNRLSVIFAGRLCDTVAPAITEMGLNDIISLPGTLEHGAAVALMLASDYLLLYEDSTQGETYVRGKAYEYLRAGRPLLAVVPDGATRDLAGRFPWVRLFYPDDVRKLADALLGLKPSAPSVNESVEYYEYRKLTRRLSDLLNEVNTQKNDRSAVMPAL